MRNEPYRELEREYQDGRILQMDYFTRLRHLVGRGQAPHEELLAQAKDLYSTGQIDHETFAPFALYYEPGLSIDLYGFPARHTPYAPTVQRLASWYLVTRYAADSDVMICETQEDRGCTVWGSRATEGANHIEADVRPEITVLTVNPPSARDEIYGSACKTLHVDNTDLQLRRQSILFRIDAQDTLRRILRRPR